MSIILNIDILGYKQNGEPWDQKLSLGELGITATLVCQTVTYIVNFLSQNALQMDFEYTSPVT